MADDTYVIETSAPVGPTIIIEDTDGTDWFTFSGVYNRQTSVTLMASYSNGVPTEASATYWTDGGSSGSLRVKGIIENARGTNGSDWIIGNQVDNILYGDQDATGVGGNDILYGDEGDDTLYGGAGDDDLSGAEDNDTLYGGAGNDIVAGGAGIDFVEGGEGADDLSGGSDIGDTVSYASSSAGVTVEIDHSGTTLGKGGDAEGDEIYGFTDVLGSAFDDVITDIVKGTVSFDYNKNVFSGGAGNDTIVLGGGHDVGNGDEGDDTLIGELGADTLSGGTGSDTFVFLTIEDSTVAAAGRDTITDFSRAENDTIDLSAIDANLDKDGDQRFRFIEDDGFSRKAGELRIKEMDDGYMVFGNVDRDKKAEFSIFVEDVNSLKGGDFDL